MRTKNQSYPIRARSHLLRLLGDELIGDDGLAIFELVKNSYDADATEVYINIDVAKDKNQDITVVDNGSGMTLEDVTGKWLELATDSKRVDRSYRSKKFHRLQLGEKGVGRLAVIKLGRYIRLITRAQGHPEYELNIDWDATSEQSNYLEDIQVEIETNDTPIYFEKKRTGTYIEISGLRNKYWPRRDIRRIYRLISSLTSPFDTPDHFNVDFEVPGKEHEIKDMLPMDGFLDNAIWKFDFKIENGSYSWKYNFSPPHWKNIKAHSSEKENDQLLLSPSDEEENKSQNDLTLKPKHLDGIGPIKGVIYAYNLRQEVLKAKGNVNQMRAWLNDNSGIRIYRDGVRVFNYGEPGDDWLRLNVKRINKPGMRLGANSIVSAIHLESNISAGLKEKTNREGFDNNETFQRFHLIVSSVFEDFQIKLSDDRKIIDETIRGTEKTEKNMRFSEAMDTLREGIKNDEIGKKYIPTLKVIEDEFNTMRDVMVSAGATGLNLAVIFHEVERGVEALAYSMENGIDEGTLKQRIDHVIQLLRGFSPLLKRNKTKLIFAKNIINISLEIRETRFDVHDIAISAPVLTEEDPDFTIRGQQNLLTSCLGNIIDNAMYWTRIRREKEGEEYQAAILIKTDWDEKADSGMIAVIDNGTGFALGMDQEKSIQAFTSTRPGGMGLGLYFSNVVMEQIGGELTIHDTEYLRDEIDFPEIYDGAAVVMRFRKG